MIKHTIAAVSLSLTSALVLAGQTAQYEVTITNITPGQTFTPQLVVTHPGNIRLFELGAPASEALAIMAEGGDTGPLADTLANDAIGVQTIAGMLAPGKSVTTQKEGSASNGYLSVAAMLIPTNDAFMALNRVPSPDCHVQPCCVVVVRFHRPGSGTDPTLCRNKSPPSQTVLLPCCRTSASWAPMP